ncbi:MAG: class I adenylate-forming enzyme family protein [Hyphomicrobiales bacterium]|nr:class I adenylate-forming enzyme family protein [Hyphomicrobiales bacterium]
MYRLDIPDRLNLAHHCLGRNAMATPDKIALIVVTDAARPDLAERWTYRELDTAVRRAAAGLLAQGLVAGDRILLRLPNTSDYALLFLGAISAGMVPVPISTQLTEREAAFLLEDSGAAAIAQTGSPRLPAPETCMILDERAIARLKAAAPQPGHADTLAEAPAYMIYTSGTTTRPKGVIHAHRTVVGRVPMHRDWQGLTGDDVMLHAGAFNWSYTLGVGLIDPWSCGATAVLYNGPKDIEAWPVLIEAVGATLFAAVPSLYRQMLKYCDFDNDRLVTLRHGLAAGEALSPALLESWRAATGKQLYEAFGMSECSTFISNGAGTPVRPGSPGKPQGGRRVAILPLSGSDQPVAPGEVGLLAIHREEPGLMLGYWRRPDEERRVFLGDWFAGGDLAAFDQDGYVWFHGRADDMMNAGGFRVSPLEVEETLSVCPGIAEIAVAERRVRDDVSVIVAYVVRQDGAGVAAGDIAAIAERYLASYKRPRQIFFVPGLPRSANGKLLRRDLALLEVDVSPTPGAPSGA